MPSLAENVALTMTLASNSPETTVQRLRSTGFQNARPEDVKRLVLARVGPVEESGA